MDIERIHTPVMLERTRRAARPGASKRDGAVLVDATLGMGGHSRRVPRAIPEAHGHRPRPRHRRARRSPASASRQFGDRARFVHTVYDGIADADALGGIRRGAGHPVRPRRLLAAARPRRARLLVLAGRPARHADGFDAAAARRPTSSPSRARTSCDASSTSTARRSSRRATPARSCGPGGRADHASGAARRRSSRRRRPSPCSGRGTRPSASSRRCASR